MTREEVILQKKATALNSIRKLYHPLAKPLSCCYEDGETQSSLRDYKVEQIIVKLERELLELKQK